MALLVKMSENLSGSFTTPNKFLTKFLGGISRDSISFVQELATFLSLNESRPRILGVKIIQNANLIRFLSLVSLLRGRPLRITTRSDYYFNPQPGIFFAVDAINLVRLHDCFPVTNPEWFKPWAGQIFRNYLSYSSGKDVYWICNSEYTMSEARKLGLPPDRLTLKYCDVSSFINCTRCGECKACTNSEIQLPFFLAVGTLEPRKNYQKLVAAFLTPELKSKNLVIVGRYGWKSRGVLRLINNSESRNIHYLGKVCDGALVELYKATEAFVSASLDEGFNIPAMEARTFGAKLMLSDTQVHRELHKGATFFDPVDVGAILSAVQKGGTRLQEQANFPHSDISSIISNSRRR